MSIRKIRRKSAADYALRIQNDSAKWLADHVIRSRDSRSWLVFRKKDGAFRSEYWFEAIVLAGGELYVHGDIGGMHFAHYGSHTHPEQVLRWMGGRSRRETAGYVAEKASIGMGGKSDDYVWSYAEEVFLNDALHHIEEYCLDGATGYFDQEDVNLEPHEHLIPAGIREAVGRILTGRSVEDARESLAEDGRINAMDVEWYRWGRVPSSRLIMAHEALRALVRLLGAEEAGATARPEVTSG